jgi:predicted DNA-binding WGR domain protein
VRSRGLVHAVTRHAQNEISIASDFFDRILLTRHWGRIELAGEGQQLITDYASEEAVAQTVEQLARMKTRCGYESA